LGSQPIRGTAYMRNTRTEADFREWVLQNRARLRTTAFLLCGDWFLADDLVQDTLGRIFSRWHKVVSLGDPSAYVNRILYNLYADHRRRPARREISKAEVDASFPTTTATHDERDDDLVRALLAVPQGQRTVLILRFFEDLSVAQTADLLNTSPGNIKSQTSRGLKALRCAIEEQQDTSEGAL
jgi:RNA polymerase sigma-70 factor (sigma-E family)